MIVLLDSGPLGLLARDRDQPLFREAREWLKRVRDAAEEVLVPDIADYEVRRELVRVGATTSLGRLDRLKATLGVARVTTAALVKAADLWAIVRRAGKPTAPDGDLDADAILAAVALLAGADVVVATMNLRHLSRFPGVDARDWTTVGKAL